MSSLGSCYIIVSTFGNPLFWRDSTYIIDNTEVESCCSLVAILGHLINEQGADVIKRVIIMGLDSIIDVKQSIERERHGKHPSSKSTCREIFEKCYEIETARKPPEEYLKYSDIVEKASLLYSCFLRELLSQSGIQLDPENTTDIIVLPAVGRPGGEWVFKGCPEDYLSKSLIEIDSKLMNKLDLEKCNQVFLVFDTTHGINYTPTMTLKLVERLAMLLWLKHGLTVKIQIYNSDPIPISTTAGKPKLSINKIYEEYIDEVEIPYVKELKFLEKCTTSEHLEERPITPIDKDVKKFIRNTISSIYSPTPLSLAYSCIEYAYDDLKKRGLEPAGPTEYPIDNTALDETIQSLRKKLNSILSGWESSIQVVNKQVTRSRVMSSKDIWALLVGLSVCQYIYNHLKENPSSLWFESRVFDSTFGLQLESIRELGERVYQRVYAPMKRIIEHELNMINLEISKVHDKSDCYIYEETGLRKSEGKKEVEKMKKREGIERVVIAHAGLLHDMVEVCFHKERAYIRYLNKNAYENVLKAVKNIYDERKKEGR